MINRYSQVTCLRSLDFAYDTTPPQDIPTKTLLQILQSPVQYQRVNVSVCVVEERENSEEFTKGNTVTPLKKVVYAVSDQTASLLLTVWGTHTFCLKNWYHFSDVSVRNFMGQTTLTTTRDTNIQTIPHAGPSVDPIVDDITTTEGELSMVNIDVQHLCPKRHSLDSVNFSTLMTRCHSCKAFCKTAKLSAVARGTLTIIDEAGTQHSFNLTDKLIRETLSLNPGPLPQPDELAALFLHHDRATVTTKGSRVLSVLVDAPPEAPSSEDAATAMA
ncbi:uncharacterized protein LOC143480149 [Brachyhypopomus gauderio]|uniref:uncharacterized protein LOC143480149 n=1 Tax=Brachyhypopomus gauderio TaxID=698409 RepID=UPI0040427213